MGDVLILLAAFIVLALGGLALLKVIWLKNAMMAKIRKDRPRRLRDDLQDTDDYIGKVNEALSEDDLDDLEEKRDY